MPPISNPKALAERGEEIYRTQYKETYERNHPGEFVAIDVETGQAYLGNTPEDAMNAAEASMPKGLFHLIQIGSPGAFRVSYTNDAPLDWVFR